MFGINDDDKKDMTSTEDNATPQVVDPAAVVEPLMHDDNLEETETIVGDYSANNSPAATPPLPQYSSSPVTNTEPEDQHSNPANDDVDDLLNLKQQALKDLSPLVGHLDQTPEEKFHTTMMMIQASDNKSLLPEAYKAAQGITDEKTKAQALLDFINEINYFTQNNQ